MSGGVAMFGAIAVILIAVTVGVVGLVMKRHGAPEAQRGPLWRFMVLLGLQAMSGAALWLTLFPPPGGPRVGDLVVATQAAPRRIEVAVGDTLIALPEAGDVADAERAPDLATALRRHPGAATVRIVGQGLPARDRDRPLDRPLIFRPPPAPVGIIALGSPEPGAPGTPFTVSGRASGLAGAAAQLIDPAGVTIASQTLSDTGVFRLTGTRGVEGVALYQVSIVAAEERATETIDVGIESVVVDPPGLRVLAGAPGPELRFLRDWAGRSGLGLEESYDLGAGVSVGGGASGLDAATLNATDLLIVDERRWAALSPAETVAVRRAVGEGMGLLLRPTGPLSPGTRRDWAALGFPLGVGDGEAPALLSATASASSGPQAAETPALTRRDIELTSPATITLASDADGQVLAAWRPVGRGRAGVWALSDSYTLVLMGRGDVHARLWADTVGALARPGDREPVRLKGWPRQGQRVAICGTPAETELEGPGGAITLAPDARSGGCAAAWPSSEGWMSLRAGDARLRSFHVARADQGRAIAAYEDRQGTIALAAQSGSGAGRAGPPTAGSPWPWFALWLALVSGAWALERWRGAGGEGSAGSTGPASRSGRVA